MAKSAKKTKKKKNGKKASKAKAPKTKKRKSSARKPTNKASQKPAKAKDKEWAAKAKTALASARGDAKVKLVAKMKKQAPSKGYAASTVEKWAYGGKKKAPTTGGSKPADVVGGESKTSGDNKIGHLKFSAHGEHNRKITAAMLRIMRNNTPKKRYVGKRGSQRLALDIERVNRHSDLVEKLNAVKSLTSISRSGERAAAALSAAISTARKRDAADRDGRRAKRSSGGTSVPATGNKA